MPFASTQSASASDGCTPRCSARSFSEMPSGPVPFSESERIRSVELLLAERVLLVERVVPVVRGPRRATRGRRAAASLSSAGPLIISCHGGHRGGRDRGLEPQQRAERLGAATEVPRGEVGLVLDAAHAVAERQPADAACTATSPARVDGRRVARDHLQRRVRVTGEHVDQRVELGVVGQTARHQLTVAVGVEPVRRHAERARARARLRAASPSARARRRSRRAPTRRAHHEPRNALCAVYANG